MIHKAAGLAEVHVFRVLAYLGYFNGESLFSKYSPFIMRPIAPQRRRSWKGRSRAARLSLFWHQSRLWGSRAAQRPRKRPARGRRWCSFPPRAGLKVVYVYLYRVIALGKHPYYFIIVFTHRCVCCKVDSRRKHPPVLMVGMVAAYLYPAGC